MSKKIKPNHLKKLLKTWSVTTPEERRAFLDLVAAESRASGHQASMTASLEDPETVLASEAAADIGRETELLIANGRYLLPSTIARIEVVMRKRRMTPSAIMGELGFSARDPSLARALAMKAALRLSVVKALEGWLCDNEAQFAAPLGRVAADGK